MEEESKKIMGGEKNRVTLTLDRKKMVREEDITNLFYRFNTSQAIVQAKSYRAVT